MPPARRRECRSALRLRASPRAALPGEPPPCRTGKSLPPLEGGGAGSFQDRTAGGNSCGCPPGSSECEEGEIKEEKKRQIASAPKINRRLALRPLSLPVRGWRGICVRETGAYVTPSPRGPSGAGYCPRGPAAAPPGLPRARGGSALLALGVPLFAPRSAAAPPASPVPLCARGLGGSPSREMAGRGGRAELCPVPRPPPPSAAALRSGAEPAALCNAPPGLPRHGRAGAGGGGGNAPHAWPRLPPSPAVLRPPRPFRSPAPQSSQTPRCGSLLAKLVTSLLSAGQINKGGKGGDRAARPDTALRSCVKPRPRDLPDLRAWLE